MSKPLKIVSDREKFKEKEQLYVALRKKVGRLYSDEILAKIPYVGGSGNFSKEWKVRAQSAEKLNEYLNKKGTALNILDLGCGNGWLSNFITKTGAEITAVDLNMEELELGARVFGQNKKLQFVYGDIFEDIFPKHSFNVILCASSIQYFPKLSILVKRLFELLKPGGEIHFIDSPVYNKSEVKEAEKRSMEYFTKAGFPEMIKYYHHHSWDELNGFKYKVNEGPKLRRIMAKLSGMPNFPWIIISKD